MRGQKGSDDASARRDIAARVDALVREHRDIAVAYATRILGDASLAEDAVQRALLQIVLRMRSGDTALLDANPRAVVLRGTRWAALKIVERRAARGQGERRAANVAGVDESEDWDRAEARLLIADILPSLPPHYRDVLRLRYLEGHPDALAAEQLRCSVKAYRRRLDRALYWARLVALRIGVSLLGGGMAAAVLRRAWRRAQERVAAADGALWTRLSAASAPGRASTVSTVLTAAMLGFIAVPQGMPASRPGVARPAASPGGGRARFGPESGPAQPAAVAALPGAARMVPGARAALASGPGAVPRAAAAAAETIDDVAVTEMAAAPARDGRAPVLVANGSGTRCDCGVLLESRDGGATWRAAPSPGFGLLLPPAYPADPRIFVRSGHAWVGQVFCALPRFGDSSCGAMPWVPAGLAVLDPAFDAGSPVIYVSTLAGLVAYDVPSRSLHTLLANTSDLLSPMPVTAAGGIGSAAVYLLTAGSQGSPGGAAAAGDVVHAAPVVGSGRLAACTRATGCAEAAVLPDRAYLVAGDRDGVTGGVLASTAGAGSVLLSLDGGASRSEVRLPRDRWIGGLQVFESAGRVAFSALLHGADERGVSLAWWRAGDAAARVVPLGAGAPPLGLAASLRWGEGHVLASAGVHGVRCSADWGQTWTPTCPAA